MGNFICGIILFLSFSVAGIASESMNPFEKRLQITLEAVKRAEATIGNPESEEYDETAYCEVLRKALNAGILDEADRMRAEYRLEIAEKNKPGNPASDFRFIDRKGNLQTLSTFNPSKSCNKFSIDSKEGVNGKVSEKISKGTINATTTAGNTKETDYHRVALGKCENAKPILLLFYDPDCDHCLQTIKSLRDSSIQEKADVLAVYAEEDRERWEETVDELPENWTVGFALDPIQDEETYVFITTPTLFLLNSKKTVMLKDTNLPSIEKALDIQP